MRLLFTWSGSNLLMAAFGDLSQQTAAQTWYLLALVIPLTLSMPIMQSPEHSTGNILSTILAQTMILDQALQYPMVLSTKIARTVVSTLLTRIADFVLDHPHWITQQRRR